MRCIHAVLLVGKWQGYKSCMQLAEKLDWKGLILTKGKGFLLCGLRSWVQIKPPRSQNYAKMDTKQ